MRSHSSSHRSSMSHRSSSMHHSSMSHRSSSLSHRTGSLHHGSSLNHRRSSISHSSLNNRPFHKHGISNAHAYAVGKATGVNINASAMGAHGAALYRFKQARDRHKLTSNNMHIKHTTLHRFNRSINNKHKSDDFLKRMRVSHTKHRYTAPKGSSINMGQEVGKAMGEFAKYIWIPILIFAIFFIIFIIFFMSGIFGTMMFMRNI